MTRDAPPTAVEAFRVARRRFVAGHRVELSDVAAELGVNRVTVHRWLGNRTAVNMSYQFSAHLAAMQLNVLHGFASGAKIIPIGGCGNLNNGNSITINDLITLSNNALCNDGYTPAQDPNRTLQECYKNALATANAATVHP